ncbi:MAG: amidase [Haliea sp.]|nr:MAG: amidase [Haliea sp.]
MPVTSHLPATTALAALDAMRAGALTSRQLVQACLDQIDRSEPQVGAWTFLDPVLALQQADACDAATRAGTARGRLHGVPVAVKDNIDTADMPTACGTPLYSGRRPTSDAAVVQRLRAEGAVILGKTVTTELAYFSPGKTRNPHNPAHTPGGSSSGSAAAVASFMAPLALGTQTNGSVIRPAAFCGVIGFKPSFGLIPRTGVLLTSSSLDQVGVFGRTLDDVALLAACLAGPEPADSATAGAPLSPSWPAAWTAARPPRIGRLVSALETEADPAFLQQLDALAAALRHLGVRCPVIDLGATVAEANRHQRTIMAVEMAGNLAGLYDPHAALMSAPLRALIEEGRAVDSADYLSSLQAAQWTGQELDALFGGCDVVMLPSAPGAAPQGLGSTGSPMFCSLASMLGLPALSLPLFTDPTGLPLGVQLLARRGQDALLLQAAQWLMANVLPLET